MKIQFAFIASNLSQSADHIIDRTINNTSNWKKKIRWNANRNIFDFIWIYNNNNFWWAGDCLMGFLTKNEFFFVVEEKEKKKHTTTALDRNSNRIWIVCDNATNDLCFLSPFLVCRDFIPHHGWRAHDICPIYMSKSIDMIPWFAPPSATLQHIATRRQVSMNHSHGHHQFTTWFQTISTSGDTTAPICTRLRNSIGTRCRYFRALIENGSSI